MKSHWFDGVTHNLGAPPDWDEKRDGECVTLPVLAHGALVQSRWRASWADVFGLLIGHSVVLTLVASVDGHPPVAIEVRP